jgi:hypothetical protein
MNVEVSLEWRLRMGGSTYANTADIEEQSLRGLLICHDVMSTPQFKSLRTHRGGKRAARRLHDDSSSLRRLKCGELVSRMYASAQCAYR